jgi:hypothetical protein
MNEALLLKSAQCTVWSQCDEHVSQVPHANLFAPRKNLTRLWQGCCDALLNVDGSREVEIPVVNNTILLDDVTLDALIDAEQKMMIDA